MRPSHTPPGIEPDLLPNKPGYIARQRHPPIQRGYAADFGAGKEKGERANPIGFIAEQVEAQAVQVEQIEDRLRWLASADALTLAAAVRDSHWTPTTPAAMKAPYSGRSQPARSRPSFSLDSSNGSR